MNTTEKQTLVQELARQGYTVRIDRWPPKATYYKPNGEAMPNLPTDPVSMQMYLGHGFTLVPPVLPKAKVVEGNGGTLTCPVCGFVAKAWIGLVSHKRKHLSGESQVEKGGMDVLSSKN